MTSQISPAEKSISVKRQKSTRIRQRLILGTSFAVSAFLGGYRGYVRRAYAACSGSGGTYTCSGTVTTTQTLTGTPLSITTAPGFSIDTASGAAFTLHGTDGLTFIDNNASTITGATVGMYAFNNTTGSLSITTTGTVTGNSGQGILAKSGFGSDDLIIHAANVSGTVDGIFAFSDSSGVLSITSTGNASASSGPGIYARTFTASSVSVTAVNVTGLLGVYVDNEGNGAATITTTGMITGTGQQGIYAFTGSNATDLTISTGAVSGVYRGIEVRHYGTGAVTITSTGTVTGTNSDAIFAYSGSTATGLTIRTADVTGYRGIYAKHLGTGALSIASTGTITATHLQGIYARDAATAGAMTISAANVYGGAGGPNNQMRAIDAYHLGSGDLTITTTGTATANNDHAILAKNYGSGLTINANNVNARFVGIHADQYGSGPLSITTTGTVTSTFSSAILAYGASSATDLTIKAADVTGGFDGISASHHGTGAVSITTTGTVTGAVRGIYAYSGPTTTDTTITAANVNGHNAGIYAGHYGSGNLSVTATGAVAANAGPGIQVNDNSSAPASISTVNVTSSGSVSGTSEGVLLTTSTGRSGNVVNAGSITGTKGIFVNGGTATITNSGTITGTGGTAIDLTATAGANTVGQQGGTINGLTLLSAAADQVHVSGGTIKGDVVGQGNAGVDFAVGAGGFTFGSSYTMSGFNTATMISGTAQIDGTINTNALTVSGGTMIVNGMVASNATTVTGGILAVNGSVTGAPTIVKNGGTLRGNGTVTATTVQSGGIIAPGNSIGTLHINGAFVQNSGSIYNVELDPNTNASDLIAVNGSATLQSGAGLNVIRYVAGDYRLGTVYTVLTSTGGLTGAYNLSGDTQDLSAFLGLKDSYDANNAYLTVVQIANPVSAAVTPNQLGVAQAIDAMPSGNPVQTGVLNVPDAAAARAAFDQLSGQSQISARGALVSNGAYVRNIALDRLHEVICTADGDEARAKACASGQPAVWAQGFGGWGGISGNANAVGVNHSTAGVLAGADVALADWRIGFFGGYSHSDFHAIGLAAVGESDDYHLGLYGGTSWNAWALRAGLSYSWDGITTDRTVAFDDFSDQLHGYDTGGTTQLFGELAYGIDWEGLNLEPFAGLSYLNLRTSPFHEGGGAAALTVQASGFEDVVSTLGLRPSVGVTLGGLEANLRGMLGWRHTFGDVVPTANVAFSGGDFFSVSGAPLTRDAAALEAGFDFSLSDGVQAGLTYGGEFSGRNTDQTARGTIRIKF